MKTSEWVSIGHPDKTADYISEYLLDRYLERDSKTRFAVEVMMKDNRVFLGGEIVSNAKLTTGEIARFVRDAVSEVGYTSEYADMWGRENVPCCDSVEVVQMIGKQSNDISIGVDNGGWGDQGIFWGMATPSEEYSFMPKDIYMARKIGMEICNMGIGGIDVKTQVTVSESGCIESVVVAVPSMSSSTEREAIDLVGELTKCENIVVNGTGRYVTHGSIGDCGITGRKLVVDFYGGNSPVGGGSPWTKDATKADLSLNIVARKIAVRESVESGCTRRVSLSCVIGSDLVGVCVMDEDYKVIRTGKISMPPRDVIKENGLDKPVFAGLCREGICWNFV